jgi:glycosyltransferase involved in cell wall biosynthesis
VHGHRKYDGIDGPQVAIAHDYLTQRGGAEKVVLSMSRAFPDAPIYTTLYDPGATYPEFADRDIRVSALNRSGFLRAHHRAALPLLPFAASSIHIDADIVLASTSGWAHGFRSSGRKIAFCHSPARWLYLPDMYLGEGAGKVKKSALALLAGYLRPWDRKSALSCDKYLAVSTMIRDRISEVYGIKATVVPSPVSMSTADGGESVREVEEWLDGSEIDGAYYLCVSRLLPYKNVGQVVRAFSGSGRRLVVVGSGPDAESIRRLKTDSVLMLSDLTDSQMVWLYQRCRATISASYEDFGLTPIEAGVWGRPSVVLRWGGFLDTVVEDVTGVFFDKPEPPSIAEALDRLESSELDSGEIRRHVKQFSEEHFAASLYAVVDDLMAAPSGVH